MKVTTEELPESQVALSFEIEDDRLQRALDAASRRIAGRVKIAGFRPGKAPRPLVERVVGKESLLQEALDELLPEAYREALRETGVQALTRPEFDVQSVSPLRATATVIVPPTVELSDYRAIHREPAEVSITDEQIDEVLERLRERHAQWVPAERSAELGDLLVMDMLATSDGRVVSNREDVDYVLEENSTLPVPGFVDHVKGMRAGEERSFDLAVPEKEEEGALAGKTLAFRVSAKDVKGKELPDLDDSFATVVGPHEDLAALRAHVEGQLRVEAEAQTRRSLEDQLVEDLLSGARLELPTKLIQEEMDRGRDRFLRNLDNLGIRPEQYNRLVGKTEQQREGELREQAEQSLRRGLALQALGAEESLEVTEEAVEERIRGAITSDGGDGRAVARALQEPELRHRVRASLLEDRAVQWLVAHATGQPEQKPSPVDPNARDPERGPA